MSKPYSIRIFLPGGDPDGLRLIEKSNWSGVGLVIPRVLFADARRHPGPLEQLAGQATQNR